MRFNNICRLVTESIDDIDVGDVSRAIVKLMTKALDLQPPKKLSIHSGWGPGRTVRLISKNITPHNYRYIYELDIGTVGGVPGAKFFVTKQLGASISIRIDAKEGIPLPKIDVSMFDESIQPFITMEQYYGEYEECVVYCTIDVPTSMHEYIASPMIDIIQAADRISN